MQTGTLKIKVKKKKKTLEFSYINAQGQYHSQKFETIPQDQIATALLKKIEESSSATFTVEFETEGDRILKLREQGQPWDRQETETETIPQRNRPQEQPQQVPGDRFHNPYNFVPALPRDGIKGELGDRKPKGHGCYHKEYWSGRISVKLTTVTPLLIPDAAEMTEDNNGHKTYPIRLDANGKPYLPPTSIKGMLRSAYEAVTNSRLSVFETKHKGRLFYRMRASEGLSLVPARIENRQIHLMLGTTPGIPQWDSQRNRWQIPKQTMYAAWLPRYKTDSHHNIGYSGMTHGHRVRVWLELYQKTITKNKKVIPIFKYWQVREIVPFNQSLGDKPTKGNAYGSHSPVHNEPMIEVEGYVCITNNNIENKHDERVFFQYNRNTNKHHESYEHLKNDWEYLIKNYQKIHQNEARGENLEWSRHIIGGDTELELQDGNLCYAYVENRQGYYKIQEIYPVMISRTIYTASPGELLSPDQDFCKLKPANQIEHLSPADRVFGWVNHKGKGSYKGQLRVHSVDCLRNDAVDNFGSEEANFPLAILGQPKPEQARFYCANDKDGKPILKGQAKAEGYKDEEQSLRGRKVYPHHKGLGDNYWDNPLECRTQQPDETNRYQEYRRPQQNNTEQRDSQNRSIKSWVKPETTFEFDIDVINLSPVELGALLWLLSSPDIHYHRLGGAKPLGFGSVWLDVDWDKTDLRLGSDWKKFYQTLLPEPAKVGNGVSCIDDFKKAVVSAYGKGNHFEQVRFITAFCNSNKGFDDAAIHYPRVTANPTPEGEAFKWFVKNEQENNQEPGQKLSLPDLASSRPQTLPLNPIQPQQNNQQRR